MIGHGEAHLKAVRPHRPEIRVETGRIGAG